MQQTNEMTGAFWPSKEMSNLTASIAAPKINSRNIVCFNSAVFHCYQRIFFYFTIGYYKRQIEFCELINSIYFHNYLLKKKKCNC